MADIPSATILSIVRAAHNLPPHTSGDALILRDRPSGRFLLVWAIPILHGPRVHDLSMGPLPEDRPLPSDGSMIAAWRWEGATQVDPIERFPGVYLNAAKTDANLAPFNAWRNALPRIDRPEMIAAHLWPAVRTWERLGTVQTFRRRFDRAGLAV